MGNVKKQSVFDDTYERIRRGDFLGIYLKDIERGILLSLTVRKSACIKKLSSEELTILENLRLVVRMALKYKDSAPDLLDLIQQGNVGLLLAMEGFNPDEGNFSTYASWWIRREITSALRGQHHSIRFSKRMRERLSQLNQAEKNLNQQLKRKASDEKIAAKMGIKIKKVREAKICRDSRMLHFSDLIDSETDEIKEALWARDASSEEKIIQKERRDLWPRVSQLLCCNGDGRILKIISEQNRERSLSEILNELGIVRNKQGVVDFTMPEKRFYVLFRRINNGDSFEDIGQDLGLTFQRVQQLEVEALNWLQHPKRKRQLESL
jgi:RNA polymerase primary sigma factor